MFEVRISLCEISIRQCCPAQRQLRANMLPERPAFAAFPGLKLTAGHQLACLVVLTGLVIERTQFDAQIIALLHEVKPLRQFA